MGNGLVNIRGRISFAKAQNEIMIEVVKKKGVDFYIDRSTLCYNTITNPVNVLFRNFYIDVFSSKNCVFERMYGKNNKF